MWILDYHVLECPVITIVICDIFSQPGSSILGPGGGLGSPIFGHVLLCSQSSQDECPNPFTEYKVKGKAEKSKVFFSLVSYAVVTPVP